MTPRTAACQATLSFHCLSEFAQIKVHWVSDIVQPFHLLLPSSPLYLNLSQHQALFQWVGSLNQVAKGQSTGTSDSASVLPMNIQGWFSLGLTSLISLLSKGPLRVFFSNHSLKASILWQSTFFMVQLSHPYMTTEKTITLTRWIFVGKVMSLLFNMLSRWVIAFPKSKSL